MISYHPSHLGLCLSMQMPREICPAQHYHMSLRIHQILWYVLCLHASQEPPFLLSHLQSDRCSKSCWLTQTGKHSWFSSFLSTALGKMQQEVEIGREASAILSCLQETWGTHCRQTYNWIMRDLKDAGNLWLLLQHAEMCSEIFKLTRLPDKKQNCQMFHQEISSWY